MPGPPSEDEKFVVCIEFNGPLTEGQLDRIRKELKNCVKKAKGRIIDNRISSE